MTTIAGKGPIFDIARTALLFVDPYKDFISSEGKLWPMVSEVGDEGRPLGVQPKRSSQIGVEHHRNTAHAINGRGEAGRLKIVAHHAAFEVANCDLTRVGNAEGEMATNEAILVTAAGLPSMSAAASSEPTGFR